MPVGQEEVLLEEYKLLGESVSHHRAFFSALIPALLTVFAGFAAMLAGEKLTPEKLPYICAISEWALALAYIWGVIGHTNVANNIAHLASLERRLNKAVGFEDAYPSLSNLASFKAANLGLSYHRALLGSGLRSLPNYRVCVNLLSGILFVVMITLTAVVVQKGQLLSQPSHLVKLGIVATVIIPFAIAVVCTVLVYRLENRLRDHLTS